MSRYFVLYNPKSKSDSGKQTAEKLKDYAGDREAEFVDITTVGDYREFFAQIADDDCLVLCGGDGTLNRFVNDTDGMERPKNLYFYSAGTGNDFLNDLGKSPDGEPIELGKYIERLPTVTVKGKSYKFINGVGYGIDGYCCEVGDKMPFI